MENAFFQEFLETGLFTIGDSDERLEHLQESIDDLQDLLKEDHSLLPSYVLVALDSKVKEDDPVLDQVEGIVTNHWKALRLKHSERPVQIHRGVILNALNNAGLEDPIAARIIFLTAINYLPYANLGSEKEIVGKLINQLGELSEKHATEKWSLIEEEPNLRFSTLKMDGIGFNNVSINANKLQEALHEAIRNEPSTNKGSNHGGNSTWGKHFADKSSEGISNIVDNALNDLAGSLDAEQIEKPLNSAFRSFKKSIKENLRSTFSSLASVQRRSKLLWWKEALYSKSLNKSYRDIDSNIIPVVMSSDLYNLLPGVTPISVDYLLKETLYQLNEKEKHEIKFIDHLKRISESRDLLFKYFENSSNAKGRITFIDFIGLLVKDEVEISEFPERTGVPLDEEIEFSDLSVAYLHNFLVKKLQNR